MEQRELNRKKLKANLRWWQILSSLATLFYVVCALFVEPWWAFIIAGSVCFLCSVILEWVANRILNLNDLRFDWAYENIRISSLWRGFTKRPWE